MWRDPTTAGISEQLRQRRMGAKMTRINNSLAPYSTLQLRHHRPQPPAFTLTQVSRQLPRCASPLPRSPRRCCSPPEQLLPLRQTTTPSPIRVLSRAPSTILTTVSTRTGVPDPDHFESILTPRNSINLHHETTPQGPQQGRHRLPI